MRVHDIEVLQHEDGAELRAKVRCQTHWVWGDEAFPLWYRFPPEAGSRLRSTNGNPFIAACLVPAMCLGEPLEIEAPVSEKLWRALPTIQAIFRCWDSRLAPIEVHAAVEPPGEPEPQHRPSHALFFSLGVDSSYSLAKELGPSGSEAVASEWLINVLGFDIYLWERERYPAVLANIEAVARRLGRRVLPVSTNLREFSDRMADWVKLYHGAALASVALALPGLFDTVKIAATHTYAELSPLGSHPILDPFWSTETLAFAHDGCEANRLEKIRRIAREPALLSVLRVCARDSETGVYNCGECPKCLMTMIGLHIAGALPDCPTLPPEIDPARIGAIPVTNNTQRIYLEQLRDALGDSPHDRALTRALESCLATR